MSALEEAFKKAYELHSSENPLSKVISKGFVFEMEDEFAIKFVKDKNNNPPYFLTKRFKEKTKGKKVNKHFWIFLMVKMEPAQKFHVGSNTPREVVKP